MKLIDKILKSEDLLKEPPILLDIGASRKLNPIWKSIAKYSICIAFDADNRDFKYIQDESKNYRGLYIFNCIVTDHDKPESNFFLTKSPHCSSLLKPNAEQLQSWAFSEFFEIDRIIKLTTRSLKGILNELDINRVDWFKSDSQGLDLRLFKNLGQDIFKKTLVAEFEPGILNSYLSEDKLHMILSYMDEIDIFWLSRMEVRGTQRILYKDYSSLFKSKSLKKISAHTLNKSPGWVGITYLNSFNSPSLFSKRDFLLGWLFSTLSNQNGFAYTLAGQAIRITEDLIFEELQHYSRNKLYRSLISPKLLLPTLKKLFSFIHPNT